MHPRYLRTHSFIKHFVSWYFLIEAIVVIPVFIYI